MKHVYKTADLKNLDVSCSLGKAAKNKKGEKYMLSESLDLGPIDVMMMVSWILVGINVFYPLS